MDRNQYRFRSTWMVGSPAADLYEVLEDFPRYPEWWREVRDLERHGDEWCAVTCRSLLPYDLHLVLRPRRRDPVHGVLEASMEGDLVGYSRWTIEPVGRRVSRLVFEEEATVTKPLLRALAPVARPAFKANHALMLWHARRGLAEVVARDRRASPPAAAREVWPDPVMSA